MSRKEIEKKVKEIIADVMEHERKRIKSEDIKEESHIKNDFGCDSLDLVEICMEVEKEFGISIPYDEKEKVSLVGELITLVEHKLKRIIMNREEVKEKLSEIVMDILGSEECEVTENADFRDDLYADSIDTVEMLLNTEREFEISIKDEEAENVRTFGDAVDLVHRIVNS